MILRLVWNVKFRVVFLSRFGVRRFVCQSAFSLPGFRFCRQHSPAKGFGVTHPLVLRPENLLNHITDTAISTGKGTDVA